MGNICFTAFWQGYGFLFRHRLDKVHVTFRRNVICNEKLLQASGAGKKKCKLQYVLAIFNQYYWPARTRASELQTGIFSRSSCILGTQRVTFMLSIQKLDGDFLIFFKMSFPTPLNWWPHFIFHWQNRDELGVTCFSHQSITNIS